MRINLDTDVKTGLLQVYWAYAHDVMADILIFQSNESAAILLYQTNPVGVQLLSYVNTFFCSIKFARLLDTWVHVYYLELWSVLPIISL